MSATYVVLSSGRRVGTVIADSHADAVATVAPKAPAGTDVKAYRHTVVPQKGRK